MSKKKGKPAPKKAPQQKAKKSAAAARPSARTAAATAGRTSQITIFIFKSPTGNKIRTAPQRAFAGPGHVEWTVVNLVDGTDVPVTITWPGEGPWGKEPIDIREGMCRKNVDDAVKGRFKYVVSALNAQEDPELEIPEM